MTMGGTARTIASNGVGGNERAEGKDWNPHRYGTTFEGAKIGAWVTTQRTRYEETAR